MAKNNLGGRPPRRRRASEQRDDAGPRDSRKQQGSEGSQEKRGEQAAQPPVQPAGEEGLLARVPLEGETPEAPETPETAGVVAGGESAEAGELGRRERHRVSQNNALGMLIEQHFEEPAAPCRSYSDLERRSRISREALSRYVTTRPARRRSPTIDSLVAIADAMHLSLESVARAAAAAAKGIVPPPEDVQQRREDAVRMPLAALSDEQFSAVLELLIQMHPLGPGSSGSRRLIPQI